MTDLEKILKGCMYVMVTIEGKGREAQKSFPSTR